MDSLRQSKVDKHMVVGLSRFQQLLLITDGTVTELLEHYSNESISVEKIVEEFNANRSALPEAHKKPAHKEESPILLRKVLLKGTETLSKYLYAESSIFLDRLPDAFRYDLVHTQIPIGNLWTKYRFETYKADFAIKRSTVSSHLAILLGVPLNSDILSRTYCVYSKGRKAMIITEKFSTLQFNT